MHKLPALILALSFCGTASAQAEQSISSSGDYEMDLGQVHGAIRGAKFMGDICSESFPSQRQANADAFAQWRKRYLPFMQEMEKHFLAMALMASGSDPQEHLKYLSEMEKVFEGYRGALKTQMTADGPEAFASQCKLYPAYLASNRMNLERYYAEQVAVIRKGPAP